MSSSSYLALCRRWCLSALICLGGMAPAVSWAQGASLVKDINPGAGDGFLDLFVPTDPPFIAFSFMVDLDGTLLFAASDGVHGFELWRSDGSSIGTSMVADLVPGPGSGFEIVNQTALVVGGKAFFKMRTEEAGVELWASDGSAAGTHLLRDLRPGPLSSGVGDLTAVGDLLFFRASDGSHPSALWVSDGSTTGTRLVSDGTSPALNSVNALARFGDRLVFSYDDGIHGREPWVSDGSEAGTFMIADGEPGPSGSRPVSFREVGEFLLFSASTSFLLDRELWRSDGTAAGTSRLLDIWPGTMGSAPTNLTVVGDRLFFTAESDDITQRELWVSDGTAAGTTLVRDIHPAGSSLPTFLTELAGLLFFTADDGVHGHELWQSDGTEVGTFMVADIHPGPESSHPGEKFAVGQELFFAATDADHGEELWSSNGSEAGTLLVADIQPGTAAASIRFWTPASGSLFFAANDGTRGLELFTLGSIPVVDIPALSWTGIALLVCALGAFGCLRLVRQRRVV